MLFIIVPAYNEEKNIGRVVSGLFEHGYNNVVVVDDGSDDGTSETAKGAGAEVIIHPVNRGQGAALQTGQDYAIREGAEIVVHFDGDGQFNPEDIAPAIELINSGDCDVVLGSKLLDGRSKIPWTKRRIIIPLARFLNHIFTGVKLSDVHNGFRVLNRLALEKIEITNSGMAHNTEIVRKIREHGLKFKEHPVEVTYYKYGQGARGGLQIVFDLLISKIIK
ncbi:MAG TPA: glycosyltransferase family 2 protein [Patescibacteria group bacterium]|nr:glycosyltransferase family 2 protein [Patescibacteria group bacterium]